MISGDKDQPELSSRGQNRFSPWPDLLNKLGHHGAENKPHIITSSSCTTASTSVLSGNVEKAVFLWHTEETWKPLCPLGSCSCVVREDAGRSMSPLLTLFISHPSRNQFQNHTRMFSTSQEHVSPFYTLIIVKLSCQRAAGSASESTTTLRSWRSRGTPGCPRTECSQPPQGSRPLLSPASPLGFFKA